MLAQPLAFSLIDRSSRLQLSLASVHPRSGRSTLENVLRSSLLFISDERSVYTLFKKNRADPFHSFTTIAQKADLNHTSIKINVCTGPQGEDDGSTASARTWAEGEGAGCGGGGKAEGGDCCVSLDTLLA